MRLFLLNLSDNFIFRHAASVTLAIKNWQKSAVCLIFHIRRHAYLIRWKLTAPFSPNRCIFEYPVSQRQTRVIKKECVQKQRRVTILYATSEVCAKCVVVARRSLSPLITMFCRLDLRKTPCVEKPQTGGSSVIKHTMGELRIISWQNYKCSEKTSARARLRKETEIISAFQVQRLLHTTEGKN